MLQNKAIESWNDVCDEFDKILHRPRNRFGWHKGIVPRYVDGSLSFHVRCEIRGVAREMWWEVRANLSPAGYDFERTDIAFGGQRQSVFIGVYENLKGPETLIPSLVRLHALKCGDYRVGNLVMPLSRIVETRNIVTEVAGFIKDREMGSIFPNRGAWSIRPAKVPAISHIT